MPSLHLLKYLMKTQRFLILIFTFHSEDGERQMFAYKTDVKNSNWEFGVGEELTLLSPFKGCGLQNPEPLYLPPGSFPHPPAWCLPGAGVILFGGGGGCALCSPLEWLSRGLNGSDLKFWPTDAAPVGAKRNVLPDLRLFCPCTLARVL